jgi:hypothetical protein
VHDVLLSTLNIIHIAVLSIAIWFGLRVMLGLWRSIGEQGFIGATLNYADMAARLRDPNVRGMLIFGFAEFTLRSGLQLLKAGPAPIPQ